jgi:glycosyltransferase involved in cell wall biosynthesis
MIPYISIVFPTMRIGGLDVIFSSLEKQTFKDFELVFADNLYEYRKDIVKEKAKQYPMVKYKHVPPISNKFPTHAYCHTINSAIVHAAGEVILFTLDYRYFPPDCLQKHVDFHQSHADHFGYAPGSKFLVTQKLKQCLPSYGFNDNYDTYMNDLNNGKLQNYMWSIFENEFDISSDPSSWPELDRTVVGYDPKVDMPPGVEVSPMHIFMHAESVKTKIVLEANGMNEALDGAHSHQDIEFAHRLRNMFDFHWIADNTNIGYRITGGHEVVKKLRLIDSIDSQAINIFNRYKNGSKERVNDWSLLEMNTTNRIKEYQ